MTLFDRRYRVAVRVRLAALSAEAAREFRIQMLQNFEEYATDMDEARVPVHGKSVRVLAA